MYVWSANRSSIYSSISREFHISLPDIGEFTLNLMWIFFPFKWFFVYFALPLSNKYSILSCNGSKRLLSSSLSETAWGSLVHNNGNFYMYFITVFAEFSCLVGSNVAEALSSLLRSSLQVQLGRVLIPLINVPEN